MTKEPTPRERQLQLIKKTLDRVHDVLEREDITLDEKQVGTLEQCSDELKNIYHTLKNKSDTDTLSGFGLIMQHNVINTMEHVFDVRTQRIQSVVTGDEDALDVERELLIANIGFQILRMKRHILALSIILLILALADIYRLYLLFV